jgi:hypothetical membrane protein
VKWIERVREFPPLRRFHLFGMAGSILLLVCVLVPMAVYRGRAGERYSPLNHFISELGEVGVSRLAPMFNVGLIASGALYVPFVLGLGAVLGGWWAAAGTLTGLVSAVSVACVGVFPMSNLVPHYAAAMVFFRSGLVTVLLVGIAIQRQRADGRVIDRRANIAGVAAILAYAAFLVVLQLKPGGATAFDATALAARPAIWTNAVLEWLILVLMMVWFFVVAACRRSAEARPLQRPALTLPSAPRQRRSSLARECRGSRADPPRRDRRRAP